MKKLLIATIFICMSMGFFTGIVDAQTTTGQVNPFDFSRNTYRLAESTNIPYVDPGNDGTTLKDYLAGLFRLMIGIAAIGSIVVIIIGGFEYIASATPFGKTEGKKRIQDAFWGLGLVLFSYLIINTINPAILQFDPDTIIPKLLVKKDHGQDAQDRYERRMLALGAESKAVREITEPLRAKYLQLYADAIKAEAENRPEEAATMRNEAANLEAEETILYFEQVTKNYIGRNDTVDLIDRWTENQLLAQKSKLDGLFTDSISKLRSIDRDAAADELGLLRIYSMESMNELLRVEMLRNNLLVSNEEKVKRLREASIAAGARINNSTLRNKFVVESTQRIKLFEDYLATEKRIENFNNTLPPSQSKF